MGFRRAGPAREAPRGQPALLRTPGSGHRVGPGVGLGARESEGGAGWGGGGSGSVAMSGLSNPLIQGRQRRCHLSAEALLPLSCSHRRAVPAGVGVRGPLGAGREGWGVRGGGESSSRPWERTCGGAPAASQQACRGRLQPTL